MNLAAGAGNIRFLRLVESEIPRLAAQTRCIRRVRPSARHQSLAVCGVASVAVVKNQRPLCRMLTIAYCKIVSSYWLLARPFMRTVVETLTS
jgi:hypothetical protein